MRTIDADKKDKIIEIVRAVAIEGRRDVELTGDDDYLRELWAIAKMHQVEHMLACVLVSKGDRRFEKKFFSSVGLTAKQSFAASEAARVFESAGIPFIILKGQVLRRLYPEEWMRNSCDVDILVHREDMERAGRELEGLGFERQEGLSAHDVSYNQGKVHIELHFDLIESHVFDEAAEVLASVWESFLANGSEHVMSDELFYFYHVAHMAKHFENGGCGIRTLLDLWFLNNKCEFSREARDELLSRGGLLKFERGMRKLCDAWFSDGGREGTEVLEEYVISGGAYGRTDNSVAVKKNKRGGRLAYFVSRVFAPTSLLKRYYPVLEKRPYLMPIYQVKRWFDAMKRDRKKYVRELRENLKTDNNADKLGEMLSSLGLTK